MLNLGIVDETHGKRGCVMEGEWIERGEGDKSERRVYWRYWLFRRLRRDVIARIYYLLRRDLIAEAKRWNERESGAGRATWMNCINTNIHKGIYLNHAQYYLYNSWIVNGRGGKQAPKYDTNYSNTNTHSRPQRRNSTKSVVSKVVSKKVIQLPNIILYHWDKQ